MPTYLLLILAWFGVAIIAVVLMGRFIAAGSGKLGRAADQSARRGALDNLDRGNKKARAATTRKREAA